MFDILQSTFGENGTAAVFFANQWWLVGFLLILMFILYFYGKNIRMEGMLIFLFAAVLLLQLDNIFAIAGDYIILITIFILLFLAYTFYKIIDR